MQRHTLRPQFAGVILILLALTALALRGGAVTNGMPDPHASGEFVAYVELPAGSRCSAIWISESWLLTAAHCVEDGQRVRVNYQRTWYEAVASRHPDYKKRGPNGEQHPNDIALLETTKRMQWTSRSWRVRLATYGDENKYPSGGINPTPYTHGTVRIAGYALGSFGNPHGADARYYRWETCDLSGSLEVNFYQLDSLCADGYATSLHGVPARGDSGGPLYVRVDSEYVILGVISMSDQTSRARYTSVVYHREWIAQTTGINSRDTAIPDPALTVRVETECGLAYSRTSNDLTIDRMDSNTNREVVLEAGGGLLVRCLSTETK